MQSSRVNAHVQVVNQCYLVTIFIIMSQSYKGEFNVFLYLPEDTEVHSGKGITPRTQRKLGFEPSSAQLKQPAARGHGWKACPDTEQSPCGLGLQQNLEGSEAECRGQCSQSS